MSTGPRQDGDRSFDADSAWSLLSELARHARAGRPLGERAGFRVHRDGVAERVAPEEAQVWIDPAAAVAFGSDASITPRAAELLSLYLPLCAGMRARAFVLAHLGQSLDGQIATASGASRYVTGRENLEHMHRLRALCDAVLVGAGTAVCDDPRLTTRLVEGENPARVVIDPSLRTLEHAALFSDGAARTVVIAAQPTPSLALPRGVELVQLPSNHGRLSPRAIVAALAARGLRRLFVEGGGVTVSRFLVASAVDRLHITVSPVILGSGRPGLSLPPIDGMEHALRPKARRFFLGEDVLFDCELERAAELEELQRAARSVQRPS